MKKIRIALTMVLVFALAFGMFSGAVAEGEDIVFTYSLVPTGTKTELNADIVDAEVGGTVTVDVMLANTGDTLQVVNALGIDVLLQTGLTYKSFTKGVSGPPGYPKAKTNEDLSKVRITFVTNGNDSFLIDLDPGSEIKVGTLTLDVAATGLVYGQQLQITVDTASDYTAVNITETSQEQPASGVDGKVEIVTRYDITWSGLVGNDETEKVGVGVVPVHEDPVKAGYTFVGWKDENEVLTPAGTALPAATEDMIYTAQWTPTEYDVTFADGTSFGDATPPTTYTIESGINVTPVKGGCTFLGWTAEPITAGDTDYNWDSATAPIANADTVGLYGDVKLTPVWKVNAEMVFADYAYAGSGNKLLLIGLSGMDTGNAVFYDGNAMFYTEDQNYLDLLNAADGTYSGANGNGKTATQYERAYLYIIPSTSTVDAVSAVLSVATGSNTVIRRDGNVNCDSEGVVNPGDFGTVDNLLAARSVTDASVQMKLEADVKTSAYDRQLFGNIDDIAEVIKLVGSI